ncbi:MAG: non-canonical purine NTP pyrophosphatase [Cyanothece sp. SIO1E1]|nr:non-canonical purine NTP pyrophosphatase [Cyanothece sp. SIO1E1]
MAKSLYSSLLFVSSNQDKLDEYRILLNLPSLRLAKVRFEEPQHVTIERLVEEKINQVKDSLGSNPFFVEHTGLSIYAWNQLPGGLTGVFMDRIGNDGICRMMQSYSGTERIAVAQIVLGYHFPNSEQGNILFHGEMHGKIAEKPRGNYNFGWDPIFIPDGHEKTYAEMSLDEKNQTSMRRKVSDSFKQFLERNFET